MEDSMILIIGGYGAVGKVVSAKLAAQFPDRVLIAGRNLNKALELSGNIGKGSGALELDIHSAGQLPFTDNKIGLVVSCIDHKNYSFVENCLVSGAHYVDITADDTFLKEIEALDSIAKENGSTALLSVGIAPGLTNLLGKQLIDKNPDTDEIDIFIFLGMGEKHGEAAYRWSFRDVNDSFAIWHEGREKPVRSFTEGKLFELPSGRRIAYRSNFADQHVLVRSTSLKSASTRLCLESPFLTGLYAFLRHSGLSRLLKIKFIQDLAIGIMHLLPGGTDVFIIKVESETGSLMLKGREEGYVTAAVAAKAAEMILRTPYRSGVFHIHQLFEAQTFIKSLDTGGRLQQYAISAIYSNSII